MRMMCVHVLLHYTCYVLRDFDMPLTPIGKTIADPPKGPPKKQDEASRVVEIAALVFANTFGTDRAIHVKPLFLKNRTLTVTCSSAPIAQEIRANQAKIVDSIKEKLGKKEV